MSMMKRPSFLSCCLLTLALTVAQAVEAAEQSGCNQCETDTVCVDLESRWIRRLGPGRQEIHLPAAHQLLEEHAGRCRGLGHVIVRGSLAGATARGGGSLRVSTGPLHRLAPAAGRHQDGMGLAMVASHPLGVGQAHQVRCDNSAGRLPSPEAAAALCPALAPAVVVQDVDYSGAGVSMTCALCSVTHAFASVSVLGKAAHVDIVLPVNNTEEATVHLLLETLPADVDTGTYQPDCYLKCDQGTRCIGRDQVCDGVQDCDAAANATSIDEGSLICALLRAERAAGLRHHTAAVVAAAGAALALLALLAVAVAAGLALRRSARARAADKAQQLNLSLVDKAPLI